MTRAEALSQLEDWHHSVASPEKAYKVATALGVPRDVVPVREFEDTRSQFKGLTINGGKEGDKVKGVDAMQLAMWICLYLDVEYESALGRGSQVKCCVKALRHHFGEI